jgi:hypothetical protein
MRSKRLFWTGKSAGMKGDIMKKESMIWGESMKTGETSIPTARDISMTKSVSKRTRGSEGMETGYNRIDMRMATINEKLKRGGVLK